MSTTDPDGNPELANIGNALDGTLDIAAHVDSYSTSSGHFPVLAVELVVVQFAIAEGVEPCLGDEDYVGVVEESN